MTPIRLVDVGGVLRHRSYAILRGLVLAGRVSLGGRDGPPLGPPSAHEVVCVCLECQRNAMPGPHGGTAGEQALVAA